MDQVCHLRQKRGDEEIGRDTATCAGMRSCTVSGWDGTTAFHSIGSTRPSQKPLIWGDNRIIDREMIFRAHGRAVDSLGGRYITAEDVGTSPDDMEFVSMETEHVVGLLGRSGDPSPVTAYGVYRGIKASAPRVTTRAEDKATRPK